MTDKNKTDIFLSALSGCLIWLLSLPITGHKEPWDAKWAYYSIALIIAGLSLGAFRKPKPLIFYIGIFTGQLLYSLISIGLSPFIVLGLFFLAISSCIGLIGVLVGNIINDYFQQQEK